MERYLGCYYTLESLLFLRRLPTSREAAGIFSTSCNFYGLSLTISHPASYFDFVVYLTKFPVLNVRVRRSKHNRDNDNNPFQHLLIVRGNAQQVQDIVNDSDDQGTGQRSQDGADAARETRPADDRSSDGIKLIPDPGRRLSGI